MSASIITDPETIGVGQIRFYDSIQPPLPAGEYTLKAKQEIQGVTTADKDPVYESDQPLLVNGPRFSIDPGTIHSLYPPANQLGTFDNALPNMVFKDFSLPWSREINPPATLAEVKARKAIAVEAPADINQVPWMGLLTIYAADMLPVGTTPAKVGTPAVMTVADLLTQKNKVLLPVLGTITDNSEKLTAVEVNLAYFQSISPTIAELPYLAHARGVNTGGKVMLGMNDDGCFSVVIGNRCPCPGSKNYIFLVSYEGHQDHLSGKTIPGSYDTIRLVLLGSWEFTGSDSTGSFKTLMADLCDDGRGGVKLLQMPKQSATDVNALAKKALEISYIPLQNDMRDGEKSTAWYRGPLVAAPTKRDFTYGPYLYSDHAMHYDPEFGLFNHAYSAAWQIGRLLALSDASFANGLFNWRNKYLKTVTDNAKNENVQEKANMLGAANENEPAFDLVTGTLSLLSDKFRKVVWPRFQTRSQDVLGDQLPGKLTGEEISFIKESNSDPLVALVKKIKK